MSKSSNRESDGFDREDSGVRQDRRKTREYLKNVLEEEEIDDEIYREVKFAPKDKKPKAKAPWKRVDNGKRSFLDGEEIV